ncbi:MAG TPA: hypothetical protein VK512_14000 [Xanthobacteraceae bacterium]|nr:hypothetical protein [Xanthobacteraceae bacterium]
MATIKIEIPDDQAEALAQMCKRIGHAEMCGVSSSDAAVRTLERGLWTLRQALAGAGFEPQ